MALLQRMNTAVQNAHKAMGILKNENDKLRSENQDLKIEVQALKEQLAELKRQQKDGSGSKVTIARRTTTTTKRKSSTLLSLDGGEETNPAASHRSSYHQNTGQANDITATIIIGDDSDLCNDTRNDEDNETSDCYNAIGSTTEEKYDTAIMDEVKQHILRSNDTSAAALKKAKSTGVSNTASVTPKITSSIQRILAKKLGMKVFAHTKKLQEIPSIIRRVRLMFSQLSSDNYHKIAEQLDEYQSSVIARCFTDIITRFAQNQLPFSLLSFSAFKQVMMSQNYYVQVLMSFLQELYVLGGKKTGFLLSILDRLKNISYGRLLRHNNGTVANQALQIGRTECKHRSWVTEALRAKRNLVYKPLSNSGKNGKTDNSDNSKKKGKQTQLVTNNYHNNTTNNSSDINEEEQEKESDDESSYDDYGDLSGESEDDSDTENNSHTSNNIIGSSTHGIQNNTTIPVANHNVQLSDDKVSNNSSSNIWMETEKYDSSSEQEDATAGAAAIDSKPLLPASTNHSSSNSDGHQRLMKYIDDMMGDSSSSDEDEPVSNHSTSNPIDGTTAVNIDEVNSNVTIDNNINNKVDGNNDIPILPMDDLSQPTVAELILTQESHDTFALFLFLQTVISLEMYDLLLDFLESWLYLATPSYAGDIYVFLYLTQLFPHLLNNGNNNDIDNNDSQNNNRKQKREFFDTIPECIKYHWHLILIKYKDEIAEVGEIFPTIISDSENNHSIDNITTIDSEGTSIAEESMQEEASLFIAQLQSCYKPLCQSLPSCLSRPSNAWTTLVPEFARDGIWCTLSTYLLANGMNNNASDVVNNCSISQASEKVFMVEQLFGIDRESICISSIQLLQILRHHGKSSHANASISSKIELLLAWQQNNDHNDGVYDHGLLQLLFRPIHATEHAILSFLTNNTTTNNNDNNHSNLDYLMQQKLQVTIRDRWVSDNKIAENGSTSTDIDTMETTLQTIQETFKEWTRLVCQPFTSLLYDNRQVSHWRLGGKQGVPIHAGQMLHTLVNNLHQKVDSFVRHQAQHSQQQLIPITEVPDLVPDDLSYYYQKYTSNTNNGDNNHNSSNVNSQLPYYLLHAQTAFGVSMFDHWASTQSCLRVLSYCDRVLFHPLHVDVSQLQHQSSAIGYAIFEKCQTLYQQIASLFGVFLWERVMRGMVCSILGFVQAVPQLIQDTMTQLKIIADNHSDSSINSSNSSDNPCTSYSHNYDGMMAKVLRYTAYVLQIVPLIWNHIPNYLGGGQHHTQTNYWIFAALCACKDALSTCVTQCEQNRKEQNQRRNNSQKDWMVLLRSQYNQCGHYQSILRQKSLFLFPCFMILPRTTATTTGNNITPSDSSSNKSNSQQNMFVSVSESAYHRFLQYAQLYQLQIHSIVSPLIMEHPSTATNATNNSYNANASNKRNNGYGTIYTNGNDHEDVDPDFYYSDIPKFWDNKLRAKFMHRTASTCKPLKMAERQETWSHWCIWQQIVKLHHPSYVLPLSVATYLSIDGNNTNNNKHYTYNTNDTNTNSINNNHSSGNENWKITHYVFDPVQYTIQISPSVSSKNSTSNSLVYFYIVLGSTANVKLGGIDFLDAIFDTIRYLPADWDILFLGGYCPRNHSMFRSNNSSNNSRYHKINYIMEGTGYVLRDKAAMKLVNYNSTSSNTAGQIDAQTLTGPVYDHLASMMYYEELQAFVMAEPLLHTDVMYYTAMTADSGAKSKRK